MNPMAERLFANSAAELIGRPLGWRLEDGAVVSFHDRKFRLDVMETPEANCVMLFDVSVQEQVEQQQQEIESLRKELQKERELRAVKSSFTTMIAHDFGTPLTSIRLKSDMMSQLAHQMPTEKMLHHFEHIQIHVDHMVALIDDLVLINRAQSDQNIFQVEPTNLEAFFSKIIDQIVMRWGRNPITLTCTGQVDNVLLDRRVVRYIASNLISNAQKYSRAHSEIQVSVHATETTVTLSVRDHGIGIPQSELGQIFNPFFRASNAGGSSGMGLGLTLVKNIVEARGGTITVNSEPGQGTSFVVTLPCAVDKA